MITGAIAMVSTDSSASHILNYFLPTAESRICNIAQKVKQNVTEYQATVKFNWRDAQQLSVWLSESDGIFALANYV